MKQVKMIKRYKFHKLNNFWGCNMVIIIMMFNILERYQESKSLKFSSQGKKKLCGLMDVKQTYCNNFVVYNIQNHCTV